MKIMLLPGHLRLLPQGSCSGRSLPWWTLEDAKAGRLVHGQGWGGTRGMSGAGGPVVLRAWKQPAA